MLSYQHAYHAGNHADVLKHLTLVLALDYLVRKETPLLYVDTHAGDGLYRSDGADARGHSEMNTGIGRLWAASDNCEPLARYCHLIRQFNPDRELACYPGSPSIAARILRDQDRLRLFERHPQAHEHLARALGSDPRVRIERADGFGSLHSVLPPPSRRALVLIDPGYERADEYPRTLEAVETALQRFATGTYLIWYPLLVNPKWQSFDRKLRRLAGRRWLEAGLEVKVSTGAMGMYGSRILVINPPWTLHEQLDVALPELCGLLAQDDAAKFTLEQGAE